jgi:hypothetical protein
MAAICVALVVAALLYWQATHGGIVSHHLLNRADLPAISDAWGLLWMPITTWVAVWRMQKRLAAKPQARGQMIAGFGVAVLVGGALAMSFSVGAESTTSLNFMMLLVAAVALPVYRAECVLGFVLAMLPVFGTMLPSIVAAVVGSASFALH